MTTPDDKTMDLIAKLHRLATNKGATEAEAANALARMQALLFKHNLSIDDINMTPEQRTASLTDVDFSVRELLRSRFGNRRVGRQWVTALAASIARYNFARTMVSRDLTRVWFVGTAENVAAVKEIWSYAVEQVCELADAAYKLSGSATDKRVWKRNFATGCGWRLDERLREQWELLQKQDASSTALVVVSDTALSEYVKARVSKKKSSYRSWDNMDGTDAGYRAGNSVVLGARAKQLAGGN